MQGAVEKSECSRHGQILSQKGRNKVAYATVVLVFPSIWHQGGLAVKRSWRRLGGVAAKCSNRGKAKRGGEAAFIMRYLSDTDTRYLMRESHRTRHGIRHVLAVPVARTCVCVISPRHCHFQVLESSRGAGAHTLCQPLMVTDLRCLLPDHPHPPLSLDPHLSPQASLSPQLTHLSPASFIQHVTHCPLNPSVAARLCVID